MLQSDKTALHYDVIAQTAHKVEKVSKELASLYRADFFSVSRAELRKQHLAKYTNELKTLLDKERKTWKPNAAQLNALHSAIKQIDKGNADVLTNLYNKLMEL